MSCINVTMSAIVDENNSTIDPEAEVKKLQDLVKKLEQQNRVLRNKQNRNHNSEKDQDGNVLNVKSENLDNKRITLQSQNINGDQNMKDKSANVTLDDFELLDIDNLGLEEEEDNWLYKSPKKLSPAQRSIDPCRWVREEFEHPSPEIEGVKRSLLYKLEEVSSQVSRSSSAGTLGSLLSPVKNDESVGNSRSRSGSSPNLQNGPSSGRRDISPQPLQSGAMPNIRQPVVVPGLGMRVNTGTFTRPKKSKIGLGTGTIRLPKENINDQLERPVIDDGEDENDSPYFEVGAADEDISSGDIMTQSQMKLDVHALARLQEESLRQSFTSSTTSSRRNLSKSMNRSGFSLGADSSPENSARSSPGRYDGDGYQNISHSNNSLASPSSQSSLGSPPDSPHGSSQHLDRKPHHLMETRRSLPNLARMAHPQGLQPLSHRTRESPPARDSSLGRTVTRQPGSGPRQSSPGRTMSPQRSGIPSPRSGIPRPGSSTRLPTPKKSGIPAAPRRSLTTPRNLQDDSWKEGCF